jgi:hypothetical protein
MINTGSTNSSQPEAQKDPCDVMMTPDHESTGEFILGETVKEAAGAPGAHASTAAGTIGSELMGPAGSVAMMGPGIGKIRLQQMCLERMANNTMNPKCILDFTKCKK